MAASKACNVEPDLSEASQLARDLELRTAERDGANALLDKLVAALDRHGGYMHPEDQDALAASREHLERAGVRKPRPVQIWTDRR